MKLTSLIFTIHPCLFLNYACFLPYTVTNIKRSSTFFLVCHCRIVQKGSLYPFRTNRNTCVKSTLLISGLCQFFLPYISINIEKSSTIFLICQYLKIRLGSLYNFRSVKSNYVKFTSLISTLNPCQFLYSIP